MAETAGIATLVLLALFLPLQGSPAPAHYGALALVATLIGTVIGRRRSVGGGALERVLYRSALAAVVALTVVVIGLIAMARVAALG